MCATRIAPLLFLLLLLAGGVPLLPASEFLIRRWTSEDGLPQNTVQSMVQTRDGYLWVGTYFGLARFDGVRFKTFDRSNTPELVEHAVAALAADDEGGLWVGTAGGVVKLLHGKATKFTVSDGLPGAKVWSLRVDGFGRLWVGTGAELAYRTEVGFTPQAGPAGFLGGEIRAMQAEGSGLLLGTQRAVLRTASAGRELELVATNSGATWSAVLPRDRAGNLWTADRFGLHQRRGSNVNSFLVRDGGSPDVVDLLFEDSSGGIWANLTLSGLHRKRGDAFERVPLEVPNSRARCLYEDREGSLWVGTDGGLLRLKPRLFRSWTRHDGLPDDHVWAVTPAGTNGVWLGTARGLARLAEGKVERLAGQRRPAFGVKTIGEDARGVLWATEHGYGVYRYAAGAFESHLDGEQFASRDYNAIYADRDGRIWLATSGGVDVLEQDKWRRLTKADGLPHNDVRVVLQGRDGTVWLGTHGAGLAGLRNAEVVRYTQEHGLASNRVWALNEDGGGALWIGTERGLHRLIGGKLTAFDISHGLPEALVNQVLEDDHGYLWLSGLRGIYRVKRAELEQVAAGLQRRAVFLAFGVGDGMVNSETNGENQPAGCKTSDGQLWFPTIQGVVCVNPREVPSANLPPPVLLEQVLANGTVVFGDDSHASLLSGGTLVIAPGEGQVLTFKFTANSLHAAEQNRFRFRLDELEPAWREAGTTRQATYTNLKPGHYHFRVQASDARGVWNEAGKVLAFRLLPRSVETAWFRVGVVLAALALVGTVHLYRLRNQRRFAEQERRHALELERARIARDLHDGLGAGLSQMALLGHLSEADLSQPEAARHRLDELRTQTHVAMRSLNEVVWATNAKHDTLTGLVDYLSRHAEDFLRAAHICCRLDIPAELPDFALAGPVRQDVFLAFKEALNNVVRHSRATEATLSLTVESDSVRLALTDNGVGFNPAEASARHRTDGGNGLPNLRERVRAAGGELELVSQPGQGTSVVVRLPRPCQPK